MRGLYTPEGAGGVKGQAGPLHGRCSRWRTCAAAAISARAGTRPCGKSRPGPTSPCTRLHLLTPPYIPSHLGLPALGRVASVAPAHCYRARPPPRDSQGLAVAPGGVGFAGRLVGWLLRHLIAMGGPCLPPRLTPHQLSMRPRGSLALLSFFSATRSLPFRYIPLLYKSAPPGWRPTSSLCGQEAH